MSSCGIVPPTITSTSPASSSRSSWMTRGHQGHVGAGEDREAHRVGVLLHDGRRDLLRRLVEAGVDDLHAGVAQAAGDDLRAAVVAVQARLGDDDADRAVHRAADAHGGSSLTHPRVTFARSSATSAWRKRMRHHLRKSADPPGREGRPARRLRPVGRPSLDGARGGGRRRAREGASPAPSRTSEIDGKAGSAVVFHAAGGARRAARRGGRDRRRRRSRTGAPPARPRRRAAARVKARSRRPGAAGRRRRRRGRRARRGAGHRASTASTATRRPATRRRTRPGRAGWRCTRATVAAGRPAPRRPGGRGRQRGARPGQHPVERPHADRCSPTTRKALADATPGLTCTVLGRARLEKLGAGRAARRSPRAPTSRRA